MRPISIAAYLLEARYLPADTYASPRGPEERHRDRWAHFLRLARPELSETRVKTVVRLAIFMIGRACLEDPELDTRQLAKLLVDITLIAPMETRWVGERVPPT